MQVRGTCDSLFYLIAPDRDYVGNSPSSKNLFEFPRVLQEGDKYKIFELPTEVKKKKKAPHRPRAAHKGEERVEHGLRGDIRGTKSF